MEVLICLGKVWWRNLPNSRKIVEGVPLYLFFVAMLFQLFVYPHFAWSAWRFTGYDERWFSQGWGSDPMGDAKQHERVWLYAMFGFMMKDMWIFRNDVLFFLHHGPRLHDLVDDELWEYCWIDLYGKGGGLHIRSEDGAERRRSRSVSWREAIFSQYCAERPDAIVEARCDPRVARETKISTSLRLVAVAICASGCPPRCARPSGAPPLPCGARRSAASPPCAARASLAGAARARTVQVTTDVARLL